MNRLTPEIEKAYRKWSRSLVGNDVTAARIIVRAITPMPSPKPAKGKRAAMSPEHKEKIRRAQLRRWAKKRMTETRAA